MCKQFALMGLLVLSLFRSSALAATRSEVINGATCVPYPPYGSSNVAAVPYQHWLYGFGQGAFCHLTRSEERRVGKEWRARSSLHEQHSHRGVDGCRASLFL